MSTLAAYARERFSPAIFGPVLGLLSAGAIWSSGSRHAIDAGRCAVMVAALVAQLRIWDDLEDLEHDRVAHPDRVLLHAAGRPFIALTVALTALIISFGLKQPAAIAGYTALIAMVWIGYRMVRPRIAVNAWRFAVLPLKYAGIAAVAALAIGEVNGPRLALAAAAAFFCASVHEAWHDPQPGAPS